jgi:chorismate mutase
LADYRWRFIGSTDKSHNGSATAFQVLRVCSMSRSIINAVSTAQKMTNPELTALRLKIDEIDEELVKLLASRFRVTEKVGKLKAQNSLQPTDPVREANQVARYRNLALENSINPEVVVAVFRAVIDEVVKNHRRA